MASPDSPAPLWHNRNWLKLWVGQLVSLVGDFVFGTTMVLWISTEVVAGRSWAPAAVGGLLISSALPILLIGPVAGVFVDRWDRRRTMMVADLVRAGLIGLLLVVPLAGGDWSVPLQLAVAYAVLILTSATSQFFNPARFIVISAVVAPEDRARAFGAASATASTAAVVGPPLAAPLLFGTGVHWALLINLGSYLVSFVVIRAIRIPPKEPAGGGDKPGFWPEFTEGLRFFAGNRSLRVMATAVWVYMFGAGAVNVLDVFFVTENLDVDPSWLGTLSAAFGVGSIVGALVVGRATAWLGEVRLFTLGIVVTGLLVLAYSRTTSLPVAVVVLALVGIPLAMVNVVVGPLVLRTTPGDLLGRVNAVLNPLVYLSSLLSMAVTSFVASTVLHDLDVVVGGVRFGRIDTIFSVAGLLMVAAGLAAARPLSRGVPTPATPDPVDRQPVLEVPRT